MQALEQPAVTADRDWNSADCCQDRARRTMELVGLIEAVGGQRLEYVSFAIFGICPDVPVISYDGIRFTYAYPSEHRGVAVLVACQHGCGLELPIEVETAAHVDLLRSAQWAHDCVTPEPPTLAERTRALTDSIGRGTR